MKLNKFAVIGVGKYGSTIACRLADKGTQVFAFDSSEEKIEAIKDKVAFAVALDSTDEKALLTQNISDLDAVVVAIGENFEATVLTCVHLMDMGVKRIIARASGAHQKLILEKIGIKEILTPEEEVAFIVRERLINPSILSFLQLPDDYEIAEIRAPEGIVGKTIAGIDFNNKYQLTFITLKREFEITTKSNDLTTEQHVIGVPGTDMVIRATDTLIIFGTSKHVAKFIDINED